MLSPEQMQFGYSRSPLLCLFKKSPYLRSSTTRTHPSYIFLTPERDSKGAGSFWFGITLILIAVGTVVFLDRVGFWESAYCLGSGVLIGSLVERWSIASKGRGRQKDD